MQSLSVIWVSLILVLLGGCDESASQPLVGTDSGVPRWLDVAPQRTTTSERIAVINLDAAIVAGRRMLGERRDVASAAALVEHLMTRVRFYGTFGDWDEALEVAQTAAREHPTDPRGLLLEAGVVQTLHEFEQAEGLVRHARGIAEELPTGPSPEFEAQMRHLELTVGSQLGLPPAETISGWRALVAGAPTFQHQVGLALALAGDRRFMEADAVFRGALEGYRDVSPFPFAWVAFQRGVMWSEQANRPDLGRPLYEEALRYLPGYVLANVHLAELDALRGDVGSAIARAKSLLGSTEDPEPLVLLASLEPSPVRAQRYARQAWRAYQRLLSRFPAAFDHHDPSGGAEGF